MKNKFLTALLLLMFILSGGCFPYSYETVSSDIIGMRKDNSGKICEKIIRYDKKLNFIALMGHDGFFRPGYFNYSRYSAFSENMQYPIHALETFPQLRYSCIKEAVPIPDSDLWITHEYKIRDINEVEVTLTIFSIKKGKIFRHIFERVKRTPPLNSKILFGYYIEYKENFRCLTVHETNRISQIDTLTGKISVLFIDNENIRDGKML